MLVKKKKKRRYSANNMGFGVGQYSFLSKSQAAFAKRHI